MILQKQIIYLICKNIHNAYYVTLVEKLSISAKILDADGINS